MSSFVKKAEDALTGNHHNSASSTNHGPHSSNLANKLDPRVDSDRGKSLVSLETSESIRMANSWVTDNRARHQAMGGTAGPHATNIGNKVDPLVDSDLGSYFITTTLIAQHSITDLFRQPGHSSQQPGWPWCWDDAQYPRSDYHRSPYF
jgi:hypothetical protein